MAARPVRAAADRDPSHRSLLRLSPAATRARATRLMRRAPRRRSRTRSSSSAPISVIAFVAETVVGATAGAVPPVGRLFQAHPRDLRPLRRAAHPRRGDVRHGPHRHAARLRAGGHRARPDGHRQGPGRRLSADRRGPAERSRSSRRSPTAPASSSTATPIWAIRWPRAAALAVQEVIRRDGLLANVVAMGEQLAAAPGRALRPSTRMSATFAGAACSGRRAGQPTAPASSRSIRRLKLHARIKREAMARGLMVYPMGGTIDGVRGDHVLLAPPFIVDASADRHDRRAARRRGRCGGRDRSSDSRHCITRLASQQAQREEHADETTRREICSLVGCRRWLRAGVVFGAGRRRSRSSSPSAPAASPASTTRSAARSAG